LAVVNFRIPRWVLARKFILFNDFGKLNENLWWRDPSIAAKAAKPARK